MADELLDQYDEYGNILGTVMKYDAHKKGKWHANAHLYLYTSDGKIILQKRKKTINGIHYIAYSAAGHVSAGETPKESILREAKEEIAYVPKNLKKLGIFKETQLREAFDNKEFIHVFVAEFDGNISELQIQEDEVLELIIIPIQQFIDECHDRELSKKYIIHEYYETLFEELQKYK